MRLFAILLLPVLIVSCGDEPQNPGPKTGEVSDKGDTRGIKDVDLRKDKPEDPNVGSGGTSEEKHDPKFGEAGKSTSSSDFYVCPKSGCKYGSAIKDDTCLTHPETTCKPGHFLCGSCSKKASAAGKCCGKDREKKIN